MSEKTNLFIGNNIRNALEGEGYVADDSEDFFPITPIAFGIKTSNWNRVFKYRLIIAEVDDQGSYSIAKAGAVDLIYNLPIAPQNLSIVMPFANQTTVLADGIMVEANGSPLKQITIQGTTGILPFRDTEQTSYDTSTLSAFAPGVGRVANNVKQAAQAFNPDSVATLLTKKQAIFENSGYTLFHKLSQFLNYFAFLQKNPKNSKLRLVFDMVKDNTTYVCTPKNFALNRTASESIEYKYTISLEAWRRIKIGSDIKRAADLKKTLGQEINSILALIRKAFKLIIAAKEMISAIRGDIQRLLDIIRTVALVIKTIAGSIVSLLDLPQAIVSDIRSAVAEFAGAINSSGNAIGAAWQRAQNITWGKAITIGSDDSLVPSSKINLTGVNSTVSQQGSTGSGSVNPLTPSKGDQSQATANGDPVGNRVAEAFNKPYDNIEFFDSLSPNQLDLPSNIQSKIEQEIERVNSLTRKDYENYRNYINEVSNDIAYAFGKGSDSLNRIKGYVPSGATAFDGNVTRSQYELLINLRKVAAVLDTLASTNINNPSPIDESFNFVGRLARDAQIPFSAKQGKFAVPVPYEASIQDIAREYLGSPDNATDIIILNRLLPPYIDEDGQFENITSNSYKRTFNVENGSNLYINQRVIFYASNIAPFSRHIVNIDKVSDSSWTIEVDGDTDLSLSLANIPKIQYFAKNTVSSRDLIYIPTNAQPLFLPDRLKPISVFSPDSTPLIAVARIDIALDSDNDLILDSTGDLKLAAGMNNIIQALRLKFSTPLGTLNRHPGYGFGIQPGTPISELNIEDLRQTISSTILNDPRFKEVLSLDVNYQNSTLFIAGTVSLNGVDNGILPFNFTI